MSATVNVDAVVPCRADRARTRLDAALGTEDHRAMVPVGPRRRRWPTTPVRTEMSDQRGAGRTSLAHLRWVPTGHLRRLLPVLDAGLAVTAIDDTSCLLVITGGYRPPLGRFGWIADRALLHRLATSTAVDFAERLAAALAHETGFTDHGREHDDPHNIRHPTGDQGRALGG
jgi:hypothetical protein